MLNFVGKCIWHLASLLDVPFWAPCWASPNAFIKDSKGQKHSRFPPQLCPDCPPQHPKYASRPLLLNPGAQCTLALAGAFLMGQVHAPHACVCTIRLRLWGRGQGEKPSSSPSLDQVPVWLLFVHSQQQRADSNDAIWESVSLVLKWPLEWACTFPAWTHCSGRSVVLASYVSGNYGPFVIYFPKETLPRNTKAPQSTLKSMAFKNCWCSDLWHRRSQHKGCDLSWWRGAGCHSQQGTPKQFLWNPKMWISSGHLYGICLCACFGKWSLAPMQPWWTCNLVPEEQLKFPQAVQTVLCLSISCGANQTVCFCLA